MKIKLSIYLWLPLCICVSLYGCIVAHCCTMVIVLHNSLSSVFGLKGQAMPNMCLGPLVTHVGLSLYIWVYNAYILQMKENIQLHPKIKCSAYLTSENAALKKLCQNLLCLDNIYWQNYCGYCVLCINWYIFM